MSEATHTSEIACLRQQITLEYEAAQRGLSGFSFGTARHDFITARMERMADHHEALKQLIGEQKAIEILAQVFEGTSQGNKDVC